MWIILYINNYYHLNIKFLIVDGASLALARQPLLSLFLTRMEPLDDHCWLFSRKLIDVEIHDCLIDAVCKPIILSRRKFNINEKNAMNVSWVHTACMHMLCNAMTLRAKVLDTRCVRYMYMYV